MGLFDAIGGALGISGDSAMLGGLGLFNGIMGMSSQADVNAQSMQMFQGNQDFQREMRDTQYQSAVKDLSAAGLNPMLAGKVGGNMASGGSSIPSLSAPYGAGMQNALTSATVAKTKADAEAALAMANNQNAQADVTKVNGHLEAQARINSLQSGATASISQSDLTKAQVERMPYEINKILSETNLNRQQEEYVWQQYRNALLTGEQIKATTGNIQLDSALKQLQSTLYSQDINFNVLDLPRRTKESAMHSSAYGSAVPYFHSAGDAARTIGAGIQLMPK